MKQYLPSVGEGVSSRVGGDGRLQMSLMNIAEPWVEVVVSFVDVAVQILSHTLNLSIQFSFSLGTKVI